MVNDFRGRIAVITGAGSGIGRALTLALAGQGAVIAISDVDELGLSETVSRVVDLGAKVRADRLDVTDRDAVMEYARAISGEFEVIHLIW